MNDNNGLPLVAPRITPALDPDFRPAVLANRAFGQQARDTGLAVPVKLALEQPGGNVSHFHTQVFPANHPQAAGNFTYLERIAKFLLWSRGGCRFYFDGPASLRRSCKRITGIPLPAGSIRISSRSGCSIMR